MSRILAIAWSEIMLRRKALFVAILLGFLPFAAPLLPWVRGSFAETRDGFAGFLAATYGIALAILLGATVLARDLAEKRIGFYFSRPLPSLALWAGKFGGAVFLVFASVGIVLLPTTLFGGGILGLIAGNLVRGRGLLAYLVILLFLLPLVHVATAMLRSPSLWLLVDFVSLLVAAGLAAACIRVFVQGAAAHLATASLAGVTALAFLALWISSAAHVKEARTDAGRGHRALSLCLWGILLCGAGALGAYTAWVLTAKPTDLQRGIEVYAAPHGTWIALSGEARGRWDYRHHYLVDTASGRSLRTRLAVPWSLPSLADDGMLAYWVEGNIPRGPFTLEVARLDVETPIVEETPLSFSPNSWPIASSPDGSRVAVMEGTTISTYEVPEGKLVASFPFRFPLRWPRLLHFMGRDRIRVFLVPSREEKPEDAADLEIVECSLADRHCETTGSLQRSSQARLAMSPDGTRVVSGHWRSEVVLADARTGAVVKELLAGEERVSRSVRHLADGKIVIGERDGADMGRIRLLDGNGEPIRTIELGQLGHLVIGGEAAPGVLVIARSRNRSLGWTGFDVSVVDLATGEVREIAKSLYPYLATYWGSTGPTAIPEPGGVAARLFRDPAGRYVLLDFDTGERDLVARK